MKSFVYWLPTQAAQAVLETAIMCAVAQAATRNRLKFGANTEPRLLVVETNQGDIINIVERTIGGGIPTKLISTSGDLLSAVNEILAEIRPATHKNVAGHAITIYRDGNITVGCQSYTKEQADRITAIVNALNGGTIDVRADGLHIRTKTGGLLMINDYTIVLESVREIVRQRDQFLAAPQSAQPFRIF